MNTLVIYSSQTGFTQKYANWIAEDLQCKSISIKEANALSLEEYDTIIFGGWICAGSIKGIKVFIKKVQNLKNKKIGFFAVGASPKESSELISTLEKISEYLNKSVENNNKIELFYCQGGLNYEKMNGASNLMMKFFIKMLKATKNQTSEDEAKIKTISSSFDASDRKYIEPIVQFAK